MHKLRVADGAWPSGKASVFGTVYRRFESYRPSQKKAGSKRSPRFVCLSIDYFKEILICSFNVLVVNEHRLWVGE